MKRSFASIIVMILLTSTFATSEAALGQCTIGAGFDLDHDPGRSDWFECRDLVTFDAGDGEKLYAGHAVASEFSLRAWADGRWTSIPGAPAVITSLYVWNNEMYIGTAGQLWKWDGVTFTLLGTFAHTSATPVVYAMHIFDLEPIPASPDGSSVLAVGGHFTSVNGMNTDSLAFWDGSSWWNASNVRDPVHALYSDVAGPLGVGEIESLFIGGANGIDTLASNDPTRTASFANNTGGQVRAIARFDGFLCHGGDYGEVVPQLGFVVNGTVNDMMVWDDGSGEKLYVVGDFTSYGGGGGFGVVIVDAAGTLYPPGAGTGVNNPGETINAMAVFKEAAAHGESMYFGGEFEYIGGGDTVYDFVRLGCAVPEPTVLTSDWELTNTFHLADANAAHYSEFDDALYVGRRNTTYGPKGLYRLDMNDNLTPIWTDDDIAGVEIDANGNIYTSDDFTGEVYRVDQGTTSRSIWVNGWHSGDDDPIGLAIAPSGASGWFGPDDAFMVDRGSSGPDEVWRWSTATAQGETVLHADDGTLENATDITISNTDVWICDSAGASPGRFFSVASNGSLQEIPTNSPIETPTAIAHNASTNQLFVLDADSSVSRIVALDPMTGDITTVVDGFVFSTATGLAWAGLDITDDGQRMYVTDGGAGRVYEFTSTTPCPPGDANGDQDVDVNDRALIDSDYGCDEPSTCDCPGDVNGDCQTTLADLGIMLRNNQLTCPEGLFDGTPDIEVSVDVYETPWPETPPDGGTYFTVDVMVRSLTGDEWSAAEATAEILGDGTFWDDPQGGSGPQPDLWTNPGMMNLRYDSYYQVPESPVETVSFLISPTNQPQMRHADWYESPDGDTAGPYLIARYTIRLDDAEADEPILLSSVGKGTPYATISGNMTSREGGGTLVPFSIPIYSAIDCLADLDDSGGINIIDTSDFLFAYRNGTDDGDLDGDGDTDRDDLAIFIAQIDCPDEPVITGGPVSHTSANIANTFGNSDISVIFDGGVTHFTMDVEINLGDDFWTSSNWLCTLTEPGYTIFQHPRFFGFPNTAPLLGEVLAGFSAAAFDTFMASPGIVIDPNPPVNIAESAVTSTSTTYGATWFVFDSLVGDTGTIARLTIEADQPVQNIELVPAGARGPNQTVIGTVVGDSTVASTLTMRYPFAFDIVVTVLPCAADIATSDAAGSDGIVNLFDLLLLLDNWGTAGAGADISADGGGESIVDLFDLLFMLDTWGVCD